MPEDRLSAFPDPSLADPDGLLGFGGSLLPGMLLDAYEQGIYPLFSPGEAILWWSPDPRCVLFPDNFHISARSRRKIAAQNFRLSINLAFEDVIAGCAEPRSPAEGDWIGPEIIKAYTWLHKLGLAWSVETWQNDKLAGGLYGVVLGPIFFGESMFHRVTEASRAALCGLVSFLISRNFLLIDCQQNSPHMLRMGATLMPRSEFIAFLEEHIPSKYPYKPGQVEEKLPRCIYNPLSGTWEEV